MMIRSTDRRRLALTACALIVALLMAACSSSSQSSAGDSQAADADAAEPPSAPSGHAHTTEAPAQPLREGEEFRNLTIPEPYTPAPPNGGYDDYRCMVIDPQLTESTFVTGAQFQPENESLVHHSIIYSVPPSSRKAAFAQDAATPGQGWTCFGSDGLEKKSGESEAVWMDTWTPGGAETLLTQDVGFKLEPGSLLMVQVHYSLLATDGESAGSDQSSLRLRTTDGTARTKTLDTVPVNAPIELPCTDEESGPLCERDAAVADVGKRFGAETGGREGQLLEECGYSKPEPGNTQHCDAEVPEPMTVYSSLGHMHLLGRSIKIEINRGTPQARTLLDVSEFDFDNQKYQPLDKPFALEKGDTIRVTCTHDASLRQKLPELADSPPRYVVYGDGTADEMCLGLLVVSGRTR